MNKHVQPKIDLSPKVSDEIRKTTCYMCACRCGINVHMKEGKVAYIEGNRDHPINKGVLCAKGFRWHHAALFPCPPQGPDETGRAAGLWGF